MNFQNLPRTPDLNLPAWGPYTKHYMGFSHLPGVDEGYRFDLSVHPGLYRFRVYPPHVLKKGPYRPWLAGADFSYVEDRHDLDGREAWCAVSYTRVEGAILVCAEYVNRTARNLNADLRLLGALYPPTIEPRCTDALRPAVIRMEDGTRWIPALDYSEGRFPSLGPAEQLSWDGTRRGEVKGHGLVDGYALRLAPGDAVCYVDIGPGKNFRIRGRMENPDAGAGLLEFSGTVSGTLEWPATNMPQVLDIAASPGRGDCLWMKNAGSTPVVVEGLVLGGGKIHFDERMPSREPVVNFDADQHRLSLDYPEISQSYALRWSGTAPCRLRHYISDDLDHFFHCGDNDTQTFYRDRGEGHFCGVMAGPIPVPAGATTRFFAWIADGANAAAALSAIADRPLDEGTCLALRDAARERVRLPTPYREGETYIPSIERMAATTVTNIVYPVRTRGTYVRHHTPGKNWDSLYTWDSGFIGLGLLELDAQRALENLNAYLTPPGDPEAAFLHHGSPVPTQFFLFWELWCRTGNAELARWAYPRLAQYHRFLMGRLGSSTTRTLGSGLLRTWDYFYNSGGWDDYPPQLHVSVQHPELRATVTPVINSALAVRTALMLARMGKRLGEPVDEYEADINSLTEALQTLCWDESAGVFGYLRHDAEGQPVGVLKHASGENFNRGLDGLMPLVSGAVCTPGQEARMLEMLFDPRRCWTPFGLSAVDQSAPYFHEEGYWNGSVWFPHQWMFWKALLDFGDGDGAFRIASTALNLWKKETDHWGDCFEHFGIKDGSGGGWTHFSGLSTPVLSWMAAYYFPGRMTGGLDVLLEEVCFHGHGAKARISAEGAGHHRPVILVNLPAPFETVAADLDGEPLRCFRRHGGCVEVTLPSGNCTGLLTVSSA